MKFKSSLLFTVLTLSFIYGAFSPAKAQTTRAANQQTSRAAAPDINFTVSMSKPWTHLLEVEMRLRGNLGQQTEVSMPVWTPGSYLVREYARHVQDFAARDGRGNQLTWDKTDKNTWQIQTRGANEILVSYKVYSNELTVRTNELNDQHAFFTPAALLMHPENGIGAPSTVRVVPYGNWKIATGLPRGGGQNTFRAENFDILYDSPFEFSNFKEFNFTVNNKPHRFVIDGEGNYDMARLQRDTQRIVETTAAIFGGELPYENYLFILNLRGGGGLEHLNSTALQANRFAFTGQRYVDFLGLVAHEFFHLWNVKRIRPDALEPFDYDRENYTKNLWVAEGGTEYFSNLILRRAGFVSDEDYLKDRATGIARLQRQPGRFQTSVEEASFDAWIKYYRPDENVVNREISYYEKGEIVNMLLDLTIRQRTNGARSLDDVMRVLYNDFYKRNRNYTPQDFQKVSEQVAGASLDDFFRRYVRGREEIDYNAIFAPAGLRLQTNRPNAAATAFLGANFEQQSDRLVVRNVPAGTPAYDQGLNANDQIIAMDGIRIAQPDVIRDFNARLEMKKPGDRIRLTFFRFDELRELTVTLAGRAPEDYRFLPVANVTDQQRKLYQGWLGTDLK